VADWSVLCAEGSQNNNGSQRKNHLGVPKTLFIEGLKELTRRVYFVTLTVEQDDQRPDSSPEVTKESILLFALGITEKGVGWS